jgi:hypothetical protein
VANAGLVPAELAVGTTSWVNQWLWDGNVVAEWELEQGLANNATVAHEVTLSLGRPDDAAHTLTLLVDAHDAILGETDEVLGEDNNRRSVTVPPDAAQRFAPPRAG